MTWKRLPFKPEQVKGARLVFPEGKTQDIHFEGARFWIHHFVDQGTHKTMRHTFEACDDLDEGIAVYRVVKTEDVSRQMQEAGEANRAQTWKILGWDLKSD